MATRNSFAQIARPIRCSAATARRAGGNQYQWSQQMIAAKHRQPLRQSRFFSAARLLQEKKYTRDHEWIEMSPDGKTCTLGISKYAADALGDVVFVELPRAAAEVKGGDAIGAVESVKSASDILTPIGGRVVEVNGALESKPARINEDPEGEAWIARIEVAEEVEGLMSEAQYKTFLEDA